MFLKWNILMQWWERSKREQENKQGTILWSKVWEDECGFAYQLHEGLPSPGCAVCFLFFFPMLNLYLKLQRFPPSKLHFKVYCFCIYLHIIIAVSWHGDGYAFISIINCSHIKIIWCTSDYLVIFSYTQTLSFYILLLIGPTKRSVLLMLLILVWGMMEFIELRNAGGRLVFR